MNSNKETSLPGLGGSVGRVGLGCMLLSLENRPERATAKAIVRRAVELGMTFLDTADVYCLDQDDIGHNERLIAEALAEMGLSAADGSDVVVATKGGLIRPAGRWESSASPERLRAACEASLRALGVDCIALYQLHAPDPAVPFADSVGALARLREEGKIRAVGLSNVDVGQIEEARSIVPVSTVQNRFTPWAVGRGPSPVVAHCAANGLVFLAYSPLGGSNLVSAIGRCRPLVALARELDASPHELALAGLLAESPAVLPIPSSTRLATVESSARVPSIELDEASTARLRAAFRRLPGRPSLLRRALGKARRTLGL